MIFLDGLKKHEKEIYYVRPFTIMDDGQYLYGKTKIIDIKELSK